MVESFIGHVCRVECFLSWYCRYDCRL